MGACNFQGKAGEGGKEGETQDAVIQVLPSCYPTEPRSFLPLHTIPFTWYSSGHGRTLEPTLCVASEEQGGKGRNTG